jgi:hypothetical protein
VDIVSPLKPKKDISLFLTTKFMHANNLIFCMKMMDKAANMQISGGFLDPDLFTSTNISQHFQQVGKAISNAMNNDYVVGAYCTSHWVTMIICMKFKEVWYLDSANQHPLLKFPDLQPVLNWSVSCRFFHKNSIS